MTDLYNYNNNFLILENAKYYDNKIYDYYTGIFKTVNYDKDLWKEIIKNIIKFNIKERCLINLCSRIKKWLEKFDKNGINTYSKIIINKYITIKICKKKDNSCNISFFILKK